MKYDAIVVGGGFAGLVAARELSKKGRTVRLLEARDRLGGRTWNVEYAGARAELGGGWVHWTQPHMWAEITRYGLELTESPAASECRTVVDGTPLVETPEVFYARVDDLMGQFCADVRELFERPFDSQRSEAFAAADAETPLQRVNRLGLSDGDQELLGGVLATVCGAKLDETSASVPLRWVGLSAWDPMLMLDVIARYKFKGGTISLINAIAADSGAEISLSTPVARVENRADGVSVWTRAGEQFDAEAVVLAVPVNVLGDLDIEPSLCGVHRVYADEGHAAKGVKIWVEVEGDVNDFFALAPPDSLLTWLQTEVHLDGRTLLIGFGPSAARLDPEDEESVTAAVRAFLPDAKILSFKGHNWANDEFARGVWTATRPGQTTKLLADFERPDGRLIIAGSDVAVGWNGFMDGAIESGLRAARYTDELLLN